MRPFRMTLIMTCAALVLLPRPVDARTRIPGVVIGIAAGAAIGALAARRAHAHRPRRHVVRHHRPRPASYARQRSRSEARTSVARAGSAAHVGWAGPVFWPYAYDDMFNYAFARKGERSQFWTYGQGDILAAVLPAASPAALAAAAGSMRLDTTASTSRADTSRPDDTPDTCLSASGGNWSIDWIKQTVQLKDTQQAKFDALAAAFAGAAEALTSTCPTDKTAADKTAVEKTDKAADQANAPEERLEAMRLRLWSMRQAVTAVQGPLEDFYNALDDAQKAALNAAVETPRDRRAPRGRTAARMDAATVVCLQRDDGNWPGKQLEQALRPNKEQRETLETLRLTAMQMGQFLMTSCPQKPLPTPLARLGAMADRLLAMEYVVLSVSPALGAFTDSLNDEQKARLGGAATQ